MWERTRGKRWIVRQPNIYPRLTKARPVHMLVMELPWHTVKWGIMMTKHCPQIKECERRVKRSMQTELHAFLCSDLTEMQRQAGCPLPQSLEFILFEIKILKPEERAEGEILTWGIIKESLFSSICFGLLNYIQMLFKTRGAGKSEATAWPHLRFCTSFLF